MFLSRQNRRFPDLIDGAANTASTTYDTLGRVSAASNALGAFSYSYVNATGRLSQATLPNGQTTQFQYFGNTGDQRLKEIKNVNGAAAVISQFDYNGSGSYQGFSCRLPLPDSSFSLRRSNA